MVCWCLRWKECIILRPLVAVTTRPAFTQRFSTVLTISALASSGLENMAGRGADAIRPGDLRLDCAKMILLNGLGHGGASTSTNNQNKTHDHHNQLAKYFVMNIENNKQYFLIHKNMDILFTLQDLASLFEPSSTKHCKISRCGRRLREFLSERAWNSSHLSMKKHIKHLVLKHGDSKNFQLSIKSTHKNRNLQFFVHWHVKLPKSIYIHDRLPLRPRIGLAHGGWHLHSDEHLPLYHHLMFAFDEGMVPFLLRYPTQPIFIIHDCCPVLI